jgi:predicted permease
VAFEQVGIALRRLREVFARDALARERDDEMAFHLEMEIEKHVRRGLSPEAARRAAAIAFGGRDRFREEVRDARGFVGADNLLRDIRLSWRRIRRAPAFAAGVVATLGIGIGAAIGIGGIVYRVLLSELPYPDADRLVRVSLVTPVNAAQGDLHSTATYVHLATAKSFDGFAAYSVKTDITITDGDDPIRVTAGNVTPGAFALLGTRPLLGTLFAPHDTNWYGGYGSPLLISEELWEQRYGRDPNIIGRTIPMNYGDRQIIGVIPRSFDFPTPDVRVWYPLALDLRHSPPSLYQRGLSVIARVKPGVSLAAASADLNTILPAISTRFPTITPAEVQAAQPRVTLTPLRDWTIAGVRGQLSLLGAMVLMVLLIATTNVVNLFLLRTERSARETAVARSLGASVGRLAQRFVSEGFLLGLVAALPATLVAGVILATRMGLSPADIPRLNEVHFDGTAIAATIAASALVGVIVGLTAFAAAMADRTGIADRLRDGARATASPAWRRARQLLVVTQVAFAVVLLVSAALLARSFDNLRRANLGFDPSRKLTFDLSLPYGPTGYTDEDKSSAFHAHVIDGLKSTPGLADAAIGITTKLPLTGAGAFRYMMTFERADGGVPRSVQVAGSIANPEYFATMGIPLERGRNFQAGDIARPAPGVVLSASVASRLFGSDNPVGRMIRRTDGDPRRREFEVVGVSGDVVGGRIEDGPDPIAYFPLLRDIDGMSPDSFPLPVSPQRGSYVIRSATLPTASVIRELLHRIDPRVSAMNLRPYASYVDAATARVRLTMLLLGVASAGALLLGVIGVYSVVAYAAAARVREFGVRLALGATPAGVARIVWGDGAMLAGIGIVVGAGIAVAGTRILRSLLFEVSATSALEFGLAVAIVAVVSLVATMVPARKAARTDPAVVLRGE